MMQNDTRKTPKKDQSGEKDQPVLMQDPVGGHTEWPRLETRVYTTVGPLPYKEATEWDHQR